MILNDYQKKWLEALESGQWKQTTEALFDGEGYCCLGVGARICGLTNDDIFEIDNLSGIIDNGTECIRKLGLRSGDGNFKSFIEVNNTGIVNLVDANDDEKLTFKEIAQLIRNNLDEVFINEDRAQNK